MNVLTLSLLSVTYFADLLADCSLQAELDISHRVVGAKKAKKGGDEPIAPSASVPARVEEIVP